MGIIERPIYLPIKIKIPAANARIPITIGGIGSAISAIKPLKVIADRYKIEYRQPGSSHVTFRYPNKQKLTVPAHKPIKPIYIKQFINLLDEQGGANETS